MERDLATIMEQDQFDATRRDGRRLALAIAADVIAYRDALQGAGITDPLLSRLVDRFHDAWLCDGEPLLMGTYLEDDE